MSVFKENAPMKAVDDQAEIVHDFTRRAPFWSYRTVPYRDYPALIELKGVLDAHLDALFRGEIDDGNGDVLDNLIFDTVRQAQADLRLQQVSHRDTIKSFGIRAESDHAAFRQELDRLKDALNENLSEQKKLRKRLACDEFKEDMSHE